MPHDNDAETLASAVACLAAAYPDSQPAPLDAATLLLKEFPGPPPIELVVVAQAIAEHARGGRWSFEINEVAVALRAAYSEMHVTPSDIASAIVALDSGIRMDELAKRLGAVYPGTELNALTLATALTTAVPVAPDETPEQRSARIVDALTRTLSPRPGVEAVAAALVSTCPSLTGEVLARALGGLGVGSWAELFACVARTMAAQWQATPEQVLRTLFTVFGAGPVSEQSLLFSREAAPALAAAFVSPPLTAEVLASALTAVLVPAETMVARAPELAFAELTDGDRERLHAEEIVGTTVLEALQPAGAQGFATISETELARALAAAFPGITRLELAMTLTQLQSDNDRGEDSVPGSTRIARALVAALNATAGEVMRALLGASPVGSVRDDHTSLELLDRPASWGAIAAAAVTNVFTSPPITPSALAVDLTQVFASPGLMTPRHGPRTSEGEVRLAAISGVLRILRARFSRAARGAALGDLTPAEAGTALAMAFPGIAPSEMALVIRGAAFPMIDPQTPELRAEMFPVARAVMAGLGSSGLTPEQLVAALGATETYWHEREIELEEVSDIGAAVVAEFPDRSIAPEIARALAALMPRLNPETSADFSSLSAHDQALRREETEKAEADRLVLALTSSFRRGTPVCAAPDGAVDDPAARALLRRNQRLALALTEPEVAAALPVAMPGISPANLFAIKQASYNCPLDPAAVNSRWDEESECPLPLAAIAEIVVAQWPGEPLAPRTIARAVAREMNARTSPSTILTPAKIELAGALVVAFAASRPFGPAALAQELVAFSADENCAPYNAGYQLDVVSLGQVLMAVFTGPAALGPREVAETLRAEFPATTPLELARALAWLQFAPADHAIRETAAALVAVYAAAEPIAPRALAAMLRDAFNHAKPCDLAVALAGAGYPPALAGPEEVAALVVEAFDGADPIKPPVLGAALVSAFPNLAPLDLLVLLGQVRFPASIKFESPDMAPTLVAAYRAPALAALVVARVVVARMGRVELAEFSRWLVEAFHATESLAPASLAHVLVDLGGTPPAPDDVACVLRKTFEPATAIALDDMSDILLADYPHLRAGDLERALARAYPTFSRDVIEQRVRRRFPDQ